MSFGFSSPCFVLRPVRLRSLARSLIAVFAPFSCSFVAFRNTMRANVDKVTPVASSSAGDDTSNAVPPVAPVPSVPSRVPAPWSSVASPSTLHVATPTSSAAYAMTTSLFDTVRSRAHVTPVVAPIVPSTPSEYTRYTGTVIGNVTEVVGSEPEELVGSPEVVMPRLDSRFLFRTDYSNLFDPTRPYPGFGDCTLRDLLVHMEAIRRWKIPYSIMCGLSVCISFRDYSVLRGLLTREYEVNMGTRAANCTSLMIPWSRFPLMPVEVLFAMPLQGLSVRLPRVAYHFSLRGRDESDDVRMRCDAAFIIEWAHFVATALMSEIENHCLVWTCSDECIPFLAGFGSLDDSYMDCVVPFVCIGSSARGSASPCSSSSVEFSRFASRLSVRGYRNVGRC